jgi:hypothetical protein
MSFYASGNTPVNSTSAPVAAPTTATLIAELDSTLLGTVSYNVGYQLDWRVTCVLGADTNVTWQIEHVTSTALTAAGAAVDAFYAKTATAQSAQYMVTWRLTKDSRIRARMASTGPNATAYLSAEPLI